MTWIKKVYLYLVSLISLVILVIAGIMLINMALKATIFKKADNTAYYAPKIACNAPANPDGSKPALDPACSDPNYEQKQREQEKESRSAQRQRDAAQAIAMIIVATPVFLYHWKLARKEA
jgi:lipopolysaccharide/colanic/teichoic acid biosynthesis glycosyltransferase